MQSLPLALWYPESGVRRGRSPLLKAKYSVQLHLLMLDAASEPLDEDVVERSSPAIHADGDAFPIRLADFAV